MTNNYKQNNIKRKEEIMALKVKTREEAIAVLRDMVKRKKEMEAKAQIDFARAREEAADCYACLLLNSPQFSFHNTGSPRCYTLRGLLLFSSLLPRKRLYIRNFLKDSGKRSERSWKTGAPAGDTRYFTSFLNSTFRLRLAEVRFVASLPAPICTAFSS